MSETSERAIQNDFWRYAICGVAMMATDYSLWWMLSVWAGWWTVAAQAASRIAGGLVSFTGNRFWTWRKRRGFNLRKQLVRFWIFWACLYVLATVAVWAISRAFPDEPRGRFLAKALADASVAVIGFLIQRTLIFR